MVLFGGGDAAGAVAACHRAGARGVVLKLGAEGCIVSDGVRKALSGIQLKGYTVIAGLGGRADRKSVV